jgi:hypothetical protein
MPAPKTPAQTIGPWLKANGMHLGGLTGQDWPALKAAAEIMGLYAKCDQRAETHVLSAFAGVVMAMQPSMRHLAYHAIAHALDWHNRAELWHRAGLPRLEHIPRCLNGPATEVLNQTLNAEIEKRDSNPPFSP